MGKARLAIGITPAHKSQRERNKSTDVGEFCLQGPEDKEIAKPSSRFSVLIAVGPHSYIWVEPQEGDKASERENDYKVLPVLEAARTLDSGILSHAILRPESSRMSLRVQE